jgi:hypothetical protein
MKLSTAAQRLRQLMFHACVGCLLFNHSELIAIAVGFFRF